MAQVSLLQKFGPIMNEGGSCISLTYYAAEKVPYIRIYFIRTSIHTFIQSSSLVAQVIPGYGGGMSSAKSALESDTKVWQRLPNMAAPS